jgi:hypothetical protein
MIKSQGVTTPQKNIAIELIRLPNLNSVRISKRGTQKAIKGQIPKTPNLKPQVEKKNYHTNPVRRNPKKKP